MPFIGRLGPSLETSASSEGNINLQTVPLEVIGLIDLGMRRDVTTYGR